MDRICGELMIANHDEAVHYFNQLLIDLKKREMGLEYSPITMERLREGSKHVRDIQACQRPAKIYH